MGHRLTVYSPIWGYSVCTEKFHRKNEIKIKITPNTHKNECGIIQLIMMGESTREIWVKRGKLEDVI